MPTTASTSPPAEPGEWRPIQVGDTILGFVEFHGAAAILTVDDDDRVTVLRLMEGAWEPVTSAPVEVTNLSGVEWGPLASDGERIVLTLTGRERNGPGGRRNRLLQTITTTDGEHFSAGAERGATVNDITYDAGRWVTIGEQFELTGWSPAVWLSRDGISWERAVIDELQRNELQLHSVTAAGGRIVALAYNTWRPIAVSTADGVDWRLVPLEVAAVIPRLKFVDGRFEVGDLHGGLESEDGVVWKPFEARSGPSDAATWGDGALEFFDGLHAGTPIPVAGSLLTAGTSTHRTDSLYCYDNVETCHEGFLAIWVRTALTWRRLQLDLPGPAFHSWGRGRGFFVEEVAYAAGTLFLTTQSLEMTEGWIRTVWTWHHAHPGLPDAAPPLDTSPPRAGHAVPDHLEPLQIGVEYAIPIATSCSPSFLSYLGTYGGVAWRSDDIGERIDPSWPSRRFYNPAAAGGSIVFGLAERVSESTVEYRVPGVGTIATFHPGTTDDLRFCA